MASSNGKGDKTDTYETQSRRLETYIKELKQLLFQTKTLKREKLNDYGSRSRMQSTDCQTTRSRKLVSDKISYGEFQVCQ